MVKAQKYLILLVVPCIKRYSACLKLLRMPRKKRENQNLETSTRVLYLRGSHDDEETVENVPVTRLTSAPVRWSREQRQATECM